MIRHTGHHQAILHIFYRRLQILLIVDVVQEAVYVEHGRCYLRYIPDETNLQSPP
jgi:hypothetical protein